MRRVYLQCWNYTVRIVDCETDEVLEGGIITARWAREICEFNGWGIDEDRSDA